MYNIIAHECRRVDKLKAVYAKFRGKCNKFRKFKLSVGSVPK